MINFNIYSDNKIIKPHKPYYKPQGNCPLMPTLTNQLSVEWKTSINVNIF